VRVVGLDQVVEQPLAPVEQKADEQAVPLVGRKAAQGMAVVAPAQLGELPTDPLRHIAEVGHAGQQALDLLQPLAGRAGEASHRRRRRRAVPANGCPSFGVVFAGQPIEGIAHGWGQTAGDTGEQAAHGLAGDGRDQAFQRGTGGQDHPRGAQQGFRTLDQIGGGQAIGGDIGQPDLKFGFRRGCERHEAEMASHPGADGAVGRRTGQREQVDRRDQAKLAGQMDDDVPRNLLRIIDKASRATQMA
jgi:hypothetical protein